MHIRTPMKLLALSLCLGTLAACTAEPPPPAQPAAPNAAATKPANANPFAGTALEAQGDALQKARDVQGKLDQAAKAQDEAIDAQAQ